MQEKRWSGGPGLCWAGLGWAGLGWAGQYRAGGALLGNLRAWAELGWAGLVSAKWARQGRAHLTPMTAGTAGHGSATCPVSTAVSTADAEEGCSRTSPFSCTCRKAPIGVGHALFVLSDDQLTRIFHSANNALCCASQIVCVCTAERRIVADGHDFSLTVCGLTRIYSRPVPVPVLFLLVLGFGRFASSARVCDRLRCICTAHVPAPALAPTPMASRLRPPPPPRPPSPPSVSGPSRRDHVVSAVAVPHHPPEAADLCAAAHGDVRHSHGVDGGAAQVAGPFGRMPRFRGCH